MKGGSKSIKSCWINKKRRNCPKIIKEKIHAKLFKPIEEIILKATWRQTAKLKLYKSSID